MGRAEDCWDWGWGPKGKGSHGMDAAIVEMDTE